MGNASHIGGLKGLAVARASQLAVERVQAIGAGVPVFATVAANMATTLQDDLKVGMEFARASISAVRSASDYDPAIHGKTDDEIADHILKCARRAQEARRGR